MSSAERESEIGDEEEGRGKREEERGRGENMDLRACERTGLDRGPPAVVVAVWSRVIILDLFLQSLDRHQHQLLADLLSPQYHVSFIIILSSRNICSNIYIRYAVGTRTSLPTSPPETCALEHLHKVDAI